jgi:hypothetical protein
VKRIIVFAVLAFAAASMQAQGASVARRRVTVTAAATTRWLSGPGLISNFRIADHCKTTCIPPRSLGLHKDDSEINQMGRKEPSRAFVGEAARNRIDVVA